MTSNWKSDLRRLKETLSLVTSGLPDFSHALVQGKGEYFQGVNLVSPKCEWIGGTSFHRIIVPLPDGGYHLHFFWDELEDGECKRGLAVLQQRLQDCQAILARVPGFVLPRIVVPTLKNGLEEKTAWWMYVLHWLASLAGNTAFHTEVGFLESEEAFRQEKKFKEWNTCSTLPEFDPRPFLTLTSPKDEGLEQWKALHLSAGKLFPEVFLSVLTKPVLYASVNAIDPLLIRSLTDSGDEPKSRRLGKRPPTGDFSEGCKRLLSILLNHHECGEGPKFTPLLQSELAEKLGCSQATVSRYFRELFEKIKAHQSLDPMRRYRRLCEDRIIDRVLLFLNDPPKRRELQTDNLEDFENRGF